MIEIAYKPGDTRYIFLRGEMDTMVKLEEFLNLYEQYQFMKMSRDKNYIPKRTIFLHRYKNPQGQIRWWCHSGLWKTIYDWCEDNNIPVTGIDNEFKYRNMPSLEEFTKIVKSWGLSLDPHPYQLEATWKILNYRQSLSQLATRAGKTLMAYIVFRYLREYCGVNNILMIVPSVHLVKQGYEDFSKYAEYFKTETVWSKGELCESADLTIGTYQSLIRKCDKKYNNTDKYDPKWFDKFDCVCVDEAHSLKCKSIDTILSQPFLKNVKLKFGFSGSLHKEHTIDSYCEHSLMGPIIQDLRSHELQELGYLRPLKVSQIRIHHDIDNDLINNYIKCGEYLNSIESKDEEGNPIKLPKEQREFTIQNVKTLPTVLTQNKGMLEPEEYMKLNIELCKESGTQMLNLEQMLLHRDKKRLGVIERILTNVGDKNIIVFAHHTEYINYLTEHFTEKFPNRNIFKITGSTSIRKRQKIVNDMDETPGCILFASYGCVSTGLTFRNIDAAIFAQSFKSEIINKQALGRGLGWYGQETPFELYDLIDYFPTRMLERQASVKAAMYKEEQHELKIYNV